jgi:hypothetical protein
MAFADTFKAVPDQFLDLLDVSQQTILANASAFAASTRTFTLDTPTMPFTDGFPDLIGLSDSAFTFAEKVLASQREFSHKLIEIYLPAKAPTPAKATTTKSV